MSKARKTDKTTGSIRIIGGQWRSRKIAVPVVEGLRPTTDRTRETVFNWLQPYLPGCRCLDVCAGSGALGFEALSRGASYADFVEIDSQAVQSIRQSINDLQAHASVWHESIFDFLRRSSIEAYDIIFIDPPFQQHMHEQILSSLASSQILADDVLVYCEKPEGGLLELERWSWFKHKKTKSIEYGLLAKDV